MKLHNGLKNKSFSRWIAITLFFTAITWVYMGNSLTHCSNVVLGAPGDHTAGIMYNSWISPGSPLLSNTTMTNYPFGENLWQPLSVSSIIPSTIHWGLSHFINIVCSWNIIVFLGYMSTALVMFGFVYWLTKNTWPSLFSAYAVTYTPYHLFASQGQLAGLLGAIFILALWQFFDLWKQPDRWKALRLGLILGVGFYIDGYFILFGGVLLLAIWIAALGYYPLFNKSNFTMARSQIYGLAISSTIVIFALLPLGWINFHFAQQIKNLFEVARGNINSDAQTYSAQLSMYINPTSLLFLGFSVILLAVIGLWLVKSDYRKKIQPTSVDIIPFVGWTLSILTFIAAWFSLQPRVLIGGVTLYNPSALIIELTSSWRVFGRLYVLVAVAVTALAGIGLAKLLEKYPARRFWIISFCFLVLVIELRLYPIYNPVKSFDYNNAPPVYSWLKNNTKVNAIAEYPLDEIPQGVYLGEYYTFQEISNKPILNSLLPNSPQAPLRRSISGINDPQTLPVLRALGIDAVNIRSIATSRNVSDVRDATLKNPGLSRIFSYRKSDVTIDSYLIQPGPLAKYALTIPSLQYFQISLTDDGSALFMVDNDTLLSIVRLPGTNTDDQVVSVNFVVSADSDRQTEIVQNGKIVWSGILRVKAQHVTIQVSPNYPLIIKNQKTESLTHVNLSKIQVIN